MPRNVDKYRRIRVRMLETGYDQESLGKRIGMSRTQVSDRMTNRVPWTVDEAYKVCDALFIPADQIQFFFPPKGNDKKEEYQNENYLHP